MQTKKHPLVNFMHRYCGFLSAYPHWALFFTGMVALIINLLSERFNLFPRPFHRLPLYLFADLVLTPGAIFLLIFHLPLILMSWFIAFHHVSAGELLNYLKKELRSFLAVIALFAVISLVFFIFKVDLRNGDNDHEILLLAAVLQAFYPWLYFGAGKKEESASERN